MTRFINQRPTPERKLCQWCRKRLRPRYVTEPVEVGVWRYTGAVRGYGLADLFCGYGCATRYAIRAVHDRANDA